MEFAFSEEEIRKIADVFGAEFSKDGATYRLGLSHTESGRRLTLEIREAVALPENVANTQYPNIVSVYGINSFLQLQGCTGYIASKDLGEVIFFAKRGGATSGLVVEREAGCSLYANVDDYLLTADFMQLPPELVMSSVALSMTDSLFGGLEG